MDMDMVGTMDEGRIISYFKNKSVLITGSTGFLGKILVEKILRVQPGVKKMYLPVRAVDAATAKERVDTEVIGKELFGLLREKHGEGFESFIQQKVVALAGDIVHEDLGIEDPDLMRELTQELNVIVNGAATTNFYERYDVALEVNVLGVRHVCDLAKKCANLEVLLHVSTAYVSGERQGLVLERAFRDGETLREGTHLDIDAEVNLVADLKRQMEADTLDSSLARAQRKSMKELGLARARHFGWPNTYVFSKAMGEMMLGRELARGGVVIVRPSIITSVLRDPLPGWIEGTRTIDAILIGYAKQTLSCFLADLDLTMDVMPGDMVVNAMMAATVAHSMAGKKKQAEAESSPVVYHVSSSLRNPAAYAVLYRTGLRYFTEHPRVGEDGQAVCAQRMYFFRTVAAFRAFMVLRYRLPLELLGLLNLLFCGLFSALYADLARKYHFVMRLVDVYGPFSLFKGCFDDLNLHKLHLAMPAATADFNFDPKTIDWDHYFLNIHIPGVMKHVLK